MNIYLANNEKHYVKKVFKKEFGKRLKVEKNLEIGDIIVGKFVIERKQVNDLMKSAIDGSLFYQMKNIQQFCEGTKYTGILLVEGKKVKHIRHLYITNPEELMVNAFEYYGIMPLQTTNLEHTVSTVARLSMLGDKPSAIKPARAYKRRKTLKDQQEFVLRGFKGVGDKRSKEIMKNYPNMMAYFQHILKNEKEGKIYKILKENWK